jgi:hypothetical protein
MPPTLPGKDAALATGLTAEEARSRLVKFGPNSNPDTSERAL